MYDNVNYIDIIASEKCEVQGEMKLFSYKNRPVHLGHYPMEGVARDESGAQHSFDQMPVQKVLQVAPSNGPLSIRHAIDDYIALLDTNRDGAVAPGKSEIPEDLQERSNNLKAFGHFLDATFVGICKIEEALKLDQPFSHPRLTEFFAEAKENMAKPLMGDIAMSFMRVAMAAQAHQKSVEGHTHLIVYAFEFPRDVRDNEPGIDWIKDLQIYRASLRAAEVAIGGANYIRGLGYEARAHSATSSDFDLYRAAVAAGIARWDGKGFTNPFVGRRFGLAAVSTTLELEVDEPLSENAKTPSNANWWLGLNSHKSARDHVPFAGRDFKDSLYPVEKLKRRDDPTSLVDAERIPRLPKRVDFFERSFIGDLGKGPRDLSIDGYVVFKNPLSGALVQILNTLVIHQKGEHAQDKVAGYDDPKRNSDIIKATLHFLGADLVGISEAPDYVWYSHDLQGNPLEPQHKYAITTLIDQGHETMEGASGDDYLSAAQSMRSYMRGSLLNGVVCKHLRRLGFPATNHTASGGDVLQPPLVLLSGLGEISRIGDVVLNPFLGPRLKCGIITTDFPLEVDKPIDFGLQKFCGSCNKCARECPSGAISAGDKVMFNGYEMWRSDVEKCTRYRMTNDDGSMCGRCMKTCPWNLEGIFKEAPFRFLATNFPSTAPLLSRIDDWLGNGDINPVKKWWWDLEMTDKGYARISDHAHARGLNTGLKLKPEDQTLSCYPADIAPTPYLEPQPLDREAGIKAYEKLITPDEYQKRLDIGETEDLVPKYVVPEGPPPVFPVLIKNKQVISEDEKIVKFDFVSMDGSPLPEFEAGAHIDIMPSAQFIRQYSLCSDPANRNHYSAAVLMEEEGTGGSLRLHQRTMPGKAIMISRPRNHFPLVKEAKRSLLLAGGIGITPLIAMGHELHAKDADFIFYYKASTRAGAGFIEELNSLPWRHNIHFHFSDENRLNVADVLGDYQDGDHLYTCGPAGFMGAVFESAGAQGWPEEALHREYFTVPGDVDYENHDFKIKLAKTDAEIVVPANTSAADALTKAGYPVDQKCSDGLCGVCICNYIEGEVEHRDYVLSKAQQTHKMTLCCSRATDKDGVITLDL